jgi:hypothetical protein
LAVEIDRMIPASGNLTVCGQQFWLGPAYGGVTITLWADATVVHLSRAGVRLKSVPSRFTTAHLRQLATETDRPAGPPPLAAGPAGPIEVDRLVNACGTVGLAARQHPIGYQFAGRRVTIRIDGTVMQFLDHTDRTLLRSLPSPLRDSDRLRDGRPAGPSPVIPDMPPPVQRRVSSRGVVMIAGQKIHVGIGHAATTVTVHTTDSQFHVYDRDQLLIEAARTATKPIARFKARKPEPPRHGSDTAVEG